ncbi:MAG: adenine phosphoribosyltransferase [Bacillales bacterium]
MDLYDTYIRSVINFPIKGINFRDITPLCANGNAFHQVIMDLNKELPSYDKYDKIICAESRGFIFGAPLASYNSKGLVLARKPNKLPMVGYKETYKLEYGEASIEIPEGAIKKGERVIILDDLIATGGSAKAMVDLVRRAGGIPIMGLFLIELRSLQGYKKLGIPCKAIVSYGLHKGDLLQIDNSHDNLVKFIDKINEDELLCLDKNDKEITIYKKDIISIVQKDSDGRLTYVRYRD